MGALANLHYVKMNGLGNEIVIVDLRRGPRPIAAEEARAAARREPYDQLMALGWKFLIEIAFLWLMVSGVVVVAKDQSWNMWVVLPSAIAGALLVGGALYLSVPKKSELVEEIK